MSEMTWEYWICLYTGTHCVARGLRPLTIGAYKAALLQFAAYAEVRLDGIAPDEVTPKHVLDYLEHLRRERNNGDSAVNRAVTILKNFYRAMVAMGYLLPAGNPLVHFPRIKATPRKLPVVLSSQEVQRLLATPPADTVLGIRDRAILALLYGTGIRASECAGLLEEDVDLDQRLIRVRGKGGHERTVPLNQQVVTALQAYRRLRLPVKPQDAFFQSRLGGPMGRGAVYDRVKTYARGAHIPKRVSPHRLRHTFATHLVKAGVGLVTIRDLLGHRLITSTQIYLHVTAKDLRQAADDHPIKDLTGFVNQLLPEVKLPFQHPPKRRQTG